MPGDSAERRLSAWSLAIMIVVVLGFYALGYADGRESGFDRGVKAMFPVAVRACAEATKESIASVAPINRRAV